MLNNCLSGHQMNVLYWNIEYPSGGPSDGHLILRYWIYVWHLNVEYSPGGSSDRCFIFEYRIAICEVLGWMFDI